MEGYTNLIDKLEIVPKVKLEHEALFDYLKDNIIKIIFYSSKIEGNKLDKSTAELLLDSGFVKHDSEFKDYLEILNHGNAYKSMIDLSSREITIQDIIDVRKALFSGVLDKDLGLRRFRNGIGMFVTCPAEDVEKELSVPIKILNTKPSSHADAIIKALEFHLKFVHIHPFDDGVGRTTRLFMNMYLLKSGLKPIFIDDKENKPYRDSLEWYHATYHETVFITNMLLFYLGSEGAELLLKKAKEFKNDNPTEVEFTSILNELLGNPIQSNITEDIKYLYNSRNINPRFGLAALWLSSKTKTDSPIISDAIASNNRNLRAAGIFAASNINIDKYVDKIKNAALNDEEYNRLLAIHMLTRNKKLDKDVIINALTQEQSEVVQCAILHALTLIKDKQPYLLEYLPRLLQSNSVSVRRRSYLLLVDYFSDEEVADLLPKLKNENEIVILPLILHLRWSGRINSDIITKAMMNLAEENKLFKDSLLAELQNGNIKDKSYPLSNVINKLYIPLFDLVIRSKDSTESERASALYMIGLINGYKYIETNYGLNLNSKVGLSERLAIFISYIDSVKQNKINPEAEKLLVQENETLNSIEGVKVGLMLKFNTGVFSSDFLLLCRERLKQWEIS